MNKPTSHWLRRLQVSDQPAYLQIADLIAEDLRTGRLVARDRLPTLRELAGDLGLNYTTVARGYAEARKRGLITSRPGMGTTARASAPMLRCVVDEGWVISDLASPRLLEISMMPRCRSTSKAFFLPPATSNVTMVPPRRICRRASPACG